MTESKPSTSHRKRRLRTGSTSPTVERADGSVRDSDRGDEFGARFDQGPKPHMFADVPRHEVR